MSAITPDASVAAVFGRSTQKRQRVIEGLGLQTVGDLLHHFPRRYVKLTELSRLDTLVAGRPITVVGEVAGVATSMFVRNGRRQHRATVTVRTQGQSFQATFFTPHQSQVDKYVRDFAPGTRAVFVGTTKLFNGAWQLDKPIGMVIGDGEDGVPLRGLMPIYPLTKSLNSWDLQKVIGTTLDLVTDVSDVLDADLRQRYRQLDVMTALRRVHQPETHADVHAGLRRFRFAEALVLQSVLARRRAAQRALGSVPRTGEQGDLLARFDASLPFELTAGQRVVGAEIEADLAAGHPMNRLLQGEVGSGKTLVALRAILKVIDSGGQAALLAPTEVLAQQHHRSITAMLGELAGGGLLGAEGATTVGLLTGSMSKAARQRVMLDAATGDAGLLIGTHALLEENVSFLDLGLVVVDEQHRFGVEQRSALTDKATTPPHVLVMTATPIPRTVAMTVFGDLEVSTLTELPAGRAAIQTTVVPLAEQPGWQERIWARVREEVQGGHQVYVVCPRISAEAMEQGEREQTEVDEDGAVLTPEGSAAAVTEVVDLLAAGPLAGLRVAPLHGRMAAEEKERTMTSFAAGEVDVLVSTTVIEVGVDVHNATAIVLLDADRFGVSQLHQLRGRVGRGGLPGLCLLVTRAEQGTPARERLAAVAATTDGFELSRVDLEQRREGDVLGANQSGFRSSLVNLRVLRDEETITQAREAAEELLAEDPALNGHRLLAAAVEAVEASVTSEFIEKN